MIEIYNNKDYKIDNTKTISFENFIKLYINHRPTDEISIHQIRKAFQILNANNNNDILNKNDFLQILLTTG